MARGTTTSFPEQALYFYVKKLFPNAINHYKEIFNNRMELDIYIPELKTGIEYDGRNWHKEDKFYLEKTKYEICKKHGIRLIRVKEIIEHRNIEGVADYIYINREPYNGLENNYHSLDRAIKEIIKHLDFRLPDFDYVYSIEDMLEELANGPIVSLSVNTKRDCNLIKENYLVNKSKNSFAAVFPEIAKQWHPIKNGRLNPNMFSSHSDHKAWWHCEVCGQDWKTAIHNRASGKGCPFCAHEKPIPGKNDLVTLRPDLMEEWDFEKNIGIDPNKLMPSSNKKVWWKCKKCGFEYAAFINLRNKGTGCRRCAGQVVVKGKNDLETLFPEIAKEWDYEGNLLKKPSETFSQSNKKVKWICNHGHKYSASPNSRIRGTACPFCSGNRVLKGFNDLETTHPEIAKEWDHEKNMHITPNSISKGYSKKVWFKCPKCGNSYESYIGNKLKGYGRCPYCESSVKSRVMKVVNLDTGEKFLTLKDAAKSINKNDIRLIQQCCVGRTKTAYGYHWKYEK